MIKIILLLQPKTRYEPMSKSINRIFLLGHIGRNPVLRYTPAGTGVVQLDLATTEYWRNKQGEKQESTQWHHIVFLHRLAEIAEKFCTKGSQIHIEGKLHHYHHQDKHG